MLVGEGETKTPTSTNSSRGGLEDPAGYKKETAKIEAVQLETKAGVSNLGLFIHNLTYG